MTEGTTIGALLDDCVGRHAERPAIIWGAGRRRRQMSFQELGAASARLAGALSARGIRSGDRVLVLQPMSPELYLVLIALFRLGAVCLFPDPQALRPTISAACRQFDPKAMIGTPAAHALRLIMPELRRVPIHVSTGLALPGTASMTALDDSRKLSCCAPAHPDSPALITFTSGSTGVPKAVPRSHRLLLSQHAAIRVLMPLPAGSACLVALPVLVLSNLLEGVASILPAADVRKPGSVRTVPLLAQMKENGANAMIVSPALLERLVAACHPGQTGLGNLTGIFTGGGPVFPKLVASVGRVFPQADLHVAYGSSEAEPIAHIVSSEISDEDRRRTLSGGGLPAGRPSALIRIAIIRSDSARPGSCFTRDAFVRLCCAPGERGEICVTGEPVVKTYADPARNVDSKIRVGEEVWHRTGDAGYLDDHGRLWLCGRWGERVPHKGGWLYPFEVEAMARHFLGSRPAACVEISGRPVLAVQGRLDTHSRQALDLALRSIGVDRVIRMRRLPMDRRHNSKIDYRALHRRLRQKFL